MDWTIGLLHGLLAWPIFVAVGVFVFVVVGSLQVLVLPFDRERRFGAVWGQRVWGRLVYWTQPLWRLHLHGFEQVQPGAYVIVSNHASMMDIPTLMHLPVPLRIVGRRSLFRIPLLGWFMALSRQIAVDADDPSASLERCRAELEAGVSVLTFPEGTRSPDGQVARFRLGAFQVAFETGAPVLVCAVNGTIRLMPRRQPWPVQGFTRVHAWVLGVLRPADFENPRAMSREARRLVCEALGQG